MWWSMDWFTRSMLLWLFVVIALGGVAVFGTGEVARLGGVGLVGLMAVGLVAAAAGLLWLLFRRPVGRE